MKRAHGQNVMYGIGMATVLLGKIPAHAQDLNFAVRVTDRWEATWTGWEFVEFSKAFDQATMAGTGECIHGILINLSSNRHAFRQQTSAEHNSGQWFAKFSLSSSFFTYNKDVFVGRNLADNAYVFGQDYLFFIFRLGFWWASSAGIYYQGDSKINAVWDDDR